MRLVYFGTAEFAVPALRRLASMSNVGAGSERSDVPPTPVILVVSQPDRPSGRGLRLTPSPVKQAALELGLPVLTPEKARAPEFVEHIRSLNADALVVAAYGQILSQSLLDAAIFGGINLHGSILPKYRGAAPIQRAILAGDEGTGVTLMQMDRGMDTGDMIAFASTVIGPDDTCGELQGRLAELAADLAESWMPAIVRGDYPRTPQTEAEASMAPKVTKAEAELRFDMTAEEAYRRFRAFTPAPGAFIHTRLGLVRVRSARMGGSHGQPGTLSGPDEIAFIAGSLRLIEIQPEGKKTMNLRDFANGYRLAIGDTLVN